MSQPKDGPDAQADEDDRLIQSFLSGGLELSGDSSNSILDLDRNLDGAAGDVLEAINAAGGQLPKNLPSPPTYRKTNPSDAPVMLLALSSPCRSRR